MLIGKNNIRVRILFFVLIILSFFTTIFYVLRTRNHESFINRELELVSSNYQARLDTVKRINGGSVLTTLSNEKSDVGEVQKEIKELVNTIKVDRNNEIAVLVKKGVVESRIDLLSWDKYEVLNRTTTNKKIEKLFLECLRDNEKNDVDKRYEHDEHIFICNEFSLVDKNYHEVGSVISLIDVTSIILSTAQFNRVTALLSILLLALFILLFNLISFHTVVKPIRELVKVAEAIVGGNYLARSRIKLSNEIGVLSSAINSVADKILESQSNLENKVIEKTEKINENKQYLEDQQKAILSILEDVEQERTVAEKQSHELKKFQLAVSRASDHIVITDPEGIVVYVNDAVKRITGFSKEEILGKKAGVKELWGGLMDLDFYKQLWKTIKTDKKSFSGEIKNKAKDGREYTAHASISPILNKKGEVIFFVGIERDITHEKEVDRMKTEFISLASHQLRTPLSAMKWFLEMLLDGDMGKLKTEQKEVVENIEKSNQRMIALVNGLLNISRIESGRIIVEPELTDLSELVNELLVELKQSAKEKQLKLTASLDKKIGELSVDPNLVREVYKNLMTNAIKYSKDGGDIKINLSKIKKEVIFEIKDSGMGIPKKEQSKIFEKFHRATNAQKTDVDGTGLGLYLAKAIAESSKGRLWFESEENKGTTFWFALPLKGMKAKKGEVYLDAMKSASKKNKEKKKGK